MSAPDGVLAVASVTTRLWTREMTALFHVSERRVRVVLGFGVVVALFFGVVIATVGSSGLDASIPAELRGTLVGTSVGGAMMTSGIIATIVSVSAPARTALQTLLDMLPVSRTAAQVGQLVPLMGLALVFSLSLSAVSFSVGLSISPSAWWSTAYVLGLVGAVVVAAVLVFAGFRAVRWALVRGLRLPHQYAVSVAGAVTVAVSVGAVAPDIFALRVAGGAWDARELLLHRAIASVASGRFGLGPWLVVLAWAGAAVLAVRSLGWTATADHGAGTTRFLVGARVPPSRFAALAWTQALGAVRSPQAIVTVLATAALIAGARLLAGHPPLSSAADVLAAAAPSVPFLLVMFAVGRVLPVRWWGQHLTGRSDWWVWPSVAAAFVVGLTLAVPVVLVEVAIGTLHLDDLGSVAARVVFAFAAALLAGTIVPYSEEQPLSATLSGFIAALLYTGSALVVPWAVDGLGPQAAPVVTAVGAVALLAVFRLTTARFEHDADARS